MLAVELTAGLGERTHMRANLALAALLALISGSLAAPVLEIRKRDDSEPWEGLIEGSKPETVNTGRRAEKDAVALAKAEAKRQRRAANRLAAASSNFVLGRQCCRVILRLLHNVASLVSTRTACLLAIQGICCTKLQY
jgi:hypothetical protein